MASKILRETGDKTRKKIIDAARKLFAKNGFAETSIDMIAEKADINQSLIFHHFQNKANLWKLVKKSFLTSDVVRAYDRNKNLREFLEEIIDERVSVYKQNPDLVRIMLWQKMEPKKNQLAGSNSLSPDNWIEEFRYRQLQKEIKKEIKPEFIVMMLVGLLEPILFQGKTDLTLEDEKNYLEFCLASILQFIQMD